MCIVHQADFLGAWESQRARRVAQRAERCVDDIGTDDAPVHHIGQFQNALACSSGWQLSIWWDLTQKHDLQTLLLLTLLHCCRDSRMHMRVQLIIFERLLCGMCASDCH